MLSDGIVTREHGLMDATGAGLAAWIAGQYGEYGLLANNESHVTFDWCALEGDHAYPVLIGGRAWNHWAVLKGFRPGPSTPNAPHDQGTLLLMNPSPGWMGVGMTLDHATFNALGPWSAVRIWHPDLFTTEPDHPVEPTLPVPPPKMTLEAAVLELKTILGEPDEVILGRVLREKVSALIDRML